MKYRKRPLVIEAIQWDGNMETIDNFNIPACSQDLTSTTLQIITLDGELTVNVGDYIIKGVKGEFYTCKPDIFEMTYEVCE